jgi:hypothetical protein
VSGGFWEKMMVLRVILMVFLDRYKVSAALNEAGLATTEYGKQVLKGLQGNLPQRRDMMGNNY